MPLSSKVGQIPSLWALSYMQLGTCLIDMQGRNSLFILHFHYAFILNLHMERLRNIAYKCTSHPFNIKTSTPRSGLFIGTLSDVMDDYEIKSLMYENFTTKNIQLTIKMISMCILLS